MMNKTEYAKICEISDKLEINNFEIQKLQLIQFFSFISNSRLEKEQTRYACRDLMYEVIHKDSWDHSTFDSFLRKFKEKVPE